MDLVGKIDPNVVLALLIPLATWLWAKAHGEKQATLKDTVLGIVDNAVHLVIVEADSRADDLVVAVERYTWMGLLKAGVPRNTATELLVHAGVQQAVAAAISAAKDHDRAMEVAMATSATQLGDAAAHLTQVSKDWPTAIATIKPREGLVELGPNDPFPAATP